MFDEQIYQDVVNELTGWAIIRNRNEVTHWENRKGAWLQMAGIARAKKEPQPEKPKPPAAVMKVLSVFGSTDTATITVAFGPELVADATCELAPIPSFEASELPQGVQAVGPYAGWGDTWVALPQDTMPDGAIVSHQAIGAETIKLRKVERRGFGNLRVSFYQLVK